MSHAPIFKLARDTPAGGRPSDRAAARTATAATHVWCAGILLPHGAALVGGRALRRPAPSAPPLAALLRRHTTHGTPLHAGPVLQAAQNVIRQGRICGAQYVAKAAAAHVTPQQRVAQRAVLPLQNGGGGAFSQ